MSTVHLPVDAGKTYAIRELRHDERSGRLVAKLVAPASNPVYTMRITGRLQKLIKVPVLARPLRRGDIIRGRFGEAFANNTKALWWVVGAQVFNAACGPVGILLTMTNRAALAIWPQAAALLA